MRGEGVVNATLRQLYLREIDLVPILQGAWGGVVFKALRY